ncbi:MAG TPA: bifunctional GNAT family N-acetyltransferase/carbon-nitrogen hydrolase family protein [Saprospiraceae bacterium]|nr:bifunctional GNAT family N-acetyltransferase/carbon-nitrogen hydrolase family protein [Saprospiraceae bacterium]HMQ84279.1 bifunctional GNAT family N-acetyltransferase/carbon-nitrogen hydrolase family protein [Saprospiraceae bacterium]
MTAKITKNAVIELRNLRLEDYLDLKESMQKAYSTLLSAYWEENQIKRLLDKFPEGQLCILFNGKVVGSALSLIVNYKKFGDSHTYNQITGNGTFDTHDPEGDVLYGIDVFIHPDYRGLRLGRRMYEARKELCENLNLKSIVFGGRIPNYKNYADKMKPRDYIRKVRQKEIHDPVLSFQLSNDFHVKRVLTNYLVGDSDSLEYAALLEWNNVYYQEEEILVNAPKQVIRLGLVQWQMRHFNDFDAFLEQAEFFVDAVSSYQSDFILFPEFFNAPLMADYNHLDEPEAIRELASYTEPLKQKFREFAISYNVNIITGSMPEVRSNGKLYNVGFLCRRDGTVETYEKIHITPSEKNAWGMVGGRKVQVFDTDCGKVGIIICYDVEFPELPRLLSEQGMKILFVPFLTDTQNGYIRVRCCAQARAIENECYVAIAGCVGNLPRVHNMDIQFAQSAVFTPSDFQFPTNGIKTEATPNAEMTLIADVDLDLLKELHNFGTVQNLKDRRKDVYRLERL